VIAAGLWPSDAGGQAVYASALADHLGAAGHEVEVVARSLLGGGPRLVQDARLAWLLSRQGYRADVIYDIGLLGEAVLGTGIVHRPLVVKLAGDPALARGRRLGLVRSGQDDTPRLWGGAPGLVLRAARTTAMRRATRVVCSSPWLAQRAAAWGLRASKLELIPNPAPRIPELRPRDELRDSFGFGGPVVAFAGRIGRERRLDRIVEALAHAPRAELVLAGGGPETDRLRDLAFERGLARRVHFLGRLPHKRVLELFHAADLAFQPAVPGLFPNAALEALTVGRPVLTTLAAGSTELVRENENGLVVDPAEPVALANAIDRYLDDELLRDRLERSASVSALPFTPERIYTQVEQLLAAVAQEAV
jgi:glycosyltransferase involved in cell wall biosynthesis